MAHGGYEPIPDWDDDYDYDVPDDDDNADQTGAFVPSSSTPTPEFQTAQKEKSFFRHLRLGLKISPSYQAFHQQLSLLRARLTKSFPM